VANLCCAGEERIIMKSLANVHGVNSVSVNIIGRYAIVRHCPAHECCASVDKIINILNSQRLGASIFEISDDDDSKPEEPFDFVKGIQVLMVWACFAVGLSLGVNLNMFLPSVIVYSVGTAIGILPFIENAYLSVLRCTIDINLLILIINFMKYVKLINLELKHQKL
jgi:cation transport ATPase